MFFFRSLGQGRSTKSIKPFSIIFHHFLEILSLESAEMRKSTIDSERQFWTAPDPNSARVLIRSRYLFWSLDPQTVSSENQEKIVLLGHFLVFSVCDVMGSAGGHHDFRGGCGLEFGLLFGTSLCGKNVTCEKEGEKNSAEINCGRPFQWALRFQH